MGGRRKYGWGHAAIIGITANIASALPAGYNGDKTYYKRLKTPPGSPPSWVFAPAWAVNNVLTLWSNLRIANLPSGTPGRRSILVSEGITWTLFAAFTTVYFGFRSPVLGAADTVAGLATTVHATAKTARLDRKAAWALVPRILWLAYASYVSVGTAVRSPDDLFDHGRARGSRRATRKSRG